jgi:hypothetical protein
MTLQQKINKIRIILCGIQEVYGIDYLCKIFTVNPKVFAAENRDTFFIEEIIGVLETIEEIVQKDVSIIVFEKAELGVFGTRCICTLDTNNNFLLSISAFYYNDKCTEIEQEIRDSHKPVFTFIQKLKHYISEVRRYAQLLNE